jgi:hypothetical protein
MNIDNYNKVIDRLEPSEKCREEVLNMGSAQNRRKKISHKSTGRIVAAVLAASVAVCGGTVAAASRLGAFDKLSNKKDRTVTYDNGYTAPIDKFDKNDYEKIAPHAVKFEEVSHAENEYFKVDLDSAYFDGTELILGFTGEMGNGNAEGLSSLYATALLEINGKQVTEKRIDMEYLPDWGCSFVIDEGSSNSFTGSMTCVLPYDARFDDTAEVTVKINNIWTNELSTYDEVEQFYRSYDILPKEKENQLVLSANVTADTSLIRKVNKEVEADGFSFKVYSISPAMTLVKAEYPESYDIAMNEEIENGTEDGFCHAVHPIAFFFDENGNYLEPLEMSDIDMENDEWAYAIASTDSKTITVKWGDKNCSSNENGSVEFYDAYGYESFGYITELTLDIS